MIGRAWFVLAIVAVILPNCSRADKFFVAPDGSDSAAGSASAPWATIAHAAKNASAGDVVHVRAGHYPEELILGRSGLPGKRIVFVSDTRHGAVLQGGNPIEKWAPCTSREDCLGASNWKALYKAKVPSAALPSGAESGWLTQGGRALRLAVERDTETTSAVYQKRGGMHELADPRNEGSCNVLYDPSLQSIDTDLKGALVWIWSHAAGNQVLRARVTSWSPVEGSLTFTPAMAKGRCLKVGKKQLRDAFVLGNHPVFIRSPGDYAVSSSSSDFRTVFLWPANPGVPDDVRYSARQTALRITGNYITFKGFQFIGYARKGAGATIHVSKGNNVAVVDSLIAVANDDGVQVDDGASHFRFERNHVRDIQGMGIQFLNAPRGRVVGNTFDNTERTAIYFAGEKTENFIVAGNRVGRQGQHGNGSAVYQCAGGGLYVDNYFSGTNVALTTNSCTHDLYVFRNVFRANADSVVAFWGGGLRGDVRILNNVILRENSRRGKNALAAGANPAVETHVWQNNVIAGSCDWKDPTQRENNIWQHGELCWKQGGRYGWKPNSSERVESMKKLFHDSSQGDFRPGKKSPLHGSGASAYALLPFDRFPDFYFGEDCSDWDIGAYTCGFGPDLDAGSEYALPIRPDS